MINPKIVVMGLGYVGLPLLVKLSTFFEVKGFDKSSDLVKNLSLGYDKTNELNSDELEKLKKLQLTSQTADIKNCNVFIVTVPTPVTENYLPDMTMLMEVSETIGSILKKDGMVIYESTVYPGATEEVCLPILEKTSGLQVNDEFYLGYSPERINPGDRENNLKNTVKVISASNKKGLDFVKSIYSKVCDKLHLASSIKVAEASKIVENIQRDVNIALVNELAEIFYEQSIDTFEVLDAAATKWNFHKYNPGLVGGHCIGIDPYYLIFKAGLLGVQTNVISSAREVNEGASNFYADLILSKSKKDKPKVLILGATFKDNCSDLRNSKVLDLYKNLALKDCKIKIFDPLADSDALKKLYGNDLLDFLPRETFDVIVVAVMHDYFKNLTLEDFKTYANDGCFLVDIKGTKKSGLVIPLLPEKSIK